jgi:hypothetical protein
LKTTYAELYERFSWRPIPHCPGRYVLPQQSPCELRLEDLTGNACETCEYEVSTARDVVVVTALDEGGLISYKRADGSLLHTLNTPEGFQRKLGQLGIDFLEKKTFVG